MMTFKMLRMLKALHILHLVGLKPREVRRPPISALGWHAGFYMSEIMEYSEI
jgi:hypothetical protein